MIKVNVEKQSNYPVSSTKIRKNLKNFLAGHGIVSDAEVSVALVGEKKMLEVGSKYLKDKSLHDVLSFTADEVDSKFVLGEAANFVYPPDGVIHLGEIIVCYPVAFEKAKEEGKLIEEKAMELIEHGARHLLGIHHE
ncbi:rRNA maturation RNase YbeY [Candidatus Woesebacteria bacterium]|nr:rRNA maturation RNase YbeY [Candidatus Woesebacteria bacterium]